MSTEKEKNIFTKSEIAIQKYTSVVKVPPRHRQRMNEFLFTNIPQYHDILNILDIGAGKGNFSLPLLKYLAEKQTLFRYWGFDISKKMIEAFYKRLSHYPSLSPERTKLWVHDASEGLPEKEFRRNFYHIVIITFVLHYLHNWQDLLRDVKEILKHDGILIQGASRGYFNCMGGIFRYCEDVPDIHINLLQRIFDWKKQMKLRIWTPTVDFTELMEVRSFIEKDLKMVFVAEETFLWKRMISFEEILDWIRLSPLSSIGADLSLQEREQLAQRARDWLLQHNINLVKKFRLTFGYNLFIYKRGS